MSEPIIYFDHASTSGCKPESVSEQIALYLRDIGASPGRGGYNTELEAYRLVSDVRSQIANILGADKKEQVAFTYNATHAINMVLKGLLKENDHVIISCFEHNAVYRPLYKLSKEKGVTFDIWQCNTLGEFNIEELKSLIQPNTRLIALNHASNVLGVRSPVEEVGAVASENQIPLLVDVSQTAGLFPVSFGPFADYIAGTGHKSLMGPSGVGYLYVKDGDTLSTLYEGGSGINSQSPYHPAKTPDKFEAGTMNYLGVAGLKGSLAYIKQYTQKKLQQEIMGLTAYALEHLQKIPHVILYGPLSTEKKVPVISLNIKGLFSCETAHLLHQNNICVRGGLQCAPLIHQTIGTFPQGTVRVSLGHTNTKKEIEKLCKILGEIDV